MSKNRDFRLWWSGLLVSELGTGISGIAYPLLVLDVTGSATQAAVVGACFYAALALISLPAGVIADRYSRRRLLIFSPLADVVAVATVAIALAAGHFWPVHLGVVAFIQGGLSALRGAASRPVLKRIVPAQQIDLALSRTLARSGAVELIGPPLGGFLYSLARWLPFGVDALSFCAATASAALLRTPLGPDRTESPGDRPRFRKELAAGLRYVWTSAYLRFLAGWSCLMGSALAALPLAVVVLLQARGAGPVLTGAAYAVGGVGGLLGAWATPWMIRRLAGRRLVLLGSWALAATTGVIAVLPHPLAIAAASGLAFFLVSPLIVVINAYETRTVPDAMQGRVQTVMLISELSVVWLALLAVGALADVFGPESAAVALAAVFTAVAIISQTTPALHQLDEPGSSS